MPDAEKTDPMGNEEANQNHFDQSGMKEETVD
jgi:hypothetical protein